MFERISKPNRKPSHFHSHVRLEGKSYREKTRLKEGNPECVTVQLLKEVLEEIGKPYSKSWKKTQLIQRVKAAREKHNSTVCLISSATTVASTASQPNTGPSGNFLRNSAGHLSTGPRSEFTTAKLTISPSSKEQFQQLMEIDRFPESIQSQDR